MKITKKNSIIILIILIILSFFLALINRLNSPKKLSEAEELQILRNERAEFFEDYYQASPEIKCQEQIEVFYNTLTHYWLEQRWDYVSGYLLPDSQAYLNQLALYEQMQGAESLPTTTLSFKENSGVVVENDICTAEILLSSQNEVGTAPVIRHFQLKLRLVDGEFLFEEINLISTE